MRAEILFCSILLVLEVLLSLVLPGVPAAGPAVGLFSVLFLATFSFSRENARKLSYAYAFFLFLIAAAPNRGSGVQVTLAVVVAIHFITWTEGFTVARRYSIKKGEPLPPDGRRGIYTVAFCGSVVLAYLFLDANKTSLPALVRGLLAFASVVCGFCLLDAGYVTRLQAASRFRRPPVAAKIRLMRMLLLIAVLTGLYYMFGRALPAAADSAHEAAGQMRKGYRAPDGDPLRADRDRAPDADWKPAGDDVWLQPHMLPSEGDFRADPSLILAMKVVEPLDYDHLLQGQIYLRGYAMDTFVGDEWLKAPDTSAEVYVDARDGREDGRIMVGSSNADRGSIVHHVRLFEPWADVMPALQGVRAYHDEMLTVRPGDWYSHVGMRRHSWIAESSPSIFENLRGSSFQLADAGESALSVDNNPIYRRMANLVSPLRDLPVEQRIDSVTKLLQERCSYSLSLRNPGKFPALENFLYGEKEGLCIHFATAATLLLRLADVPARVAFGFSGGEYYADREVFAFRALDAHAWVEVYFEDYGWTVVDPTPTGSGAARPPKVTNAKDDYLSKTEPAPAPEAEETTQGKSSVASWMRWVHSIPWGIVTAVLLGCVFGVAMLISWRQNRRDATKEGSVLNIAGKDETPKYLQDLYTCCERRFGVKKRQQETLLEYVDQLKFAGALRNEFDALTGYHYGVYYEGTKADRTKEAAFRQDVKDFANQNPERK